MNIFSSSRQLSWILMVLAVLVLMVSSFWIGIVVGERKSAHFSPWYESYHRGFAPPAGPGRFPMPPPPGLPNAHGLAGKIVAASATNLVIQGRDNLEQNILITSSTKIRVGTRTGLIEDLNAGAEVVVFGAPVSEGAIEARLIRIFGLPN